jgi:hypothetical protein
LKIKNVVKGAVKAIGPDMRARCGIDELAANPLN